MDSRGFSSHREHSEEPELLQPRVEPDGQLKHALFKGWRLAPKPQPPMSDRLLHHTITLELSLLTYNGNPSPPNVGTSMSVSSFVNQSQWSSWDDEEDKMRSRIRNAYTGYPSVQLSSALPATDQNSAHHTMIWELNSINNRTFLCNMKVWFVFSLPMLPWELDIYYFSVGDLSFLQLYFSSSLCFPCSVISLCCGVKGWIFSFKINLLGITYN